jgi:hypothetical protein
MNGRAKIILACIGCLTLGYFVGREHLKYEMRTAMHDAVSAMQAGIPAGFAGGDGAAAASEADVKTSAEDQPIVVRLTDKGFSPKDIHNGKFEEQITISIEFANRTGKDIRAFDGVIQFTDLLDNSILGSRVEINERVANGSALSWDGSLKYNQFQNGHQRLLVEPEQNLKVTFNTGKILFEDGTTETYN